MLPLPPKNPPDPDRAFAAPAPGASAAPRYPCGRALLRHIMRGGFLGFGLVAVGLVLTLELTLSRRPGLHPGWWLLYPVVYVVTSLAYGWLRWGLSGRSRRHPSREHRKARWARRIVAGVATVPVLFVVLLVAGAGAGSYHWDGGYAPARYAFTVVGADGDPIQGAELRVLGPTRDTRAEDWSQFVSWDTDLPVLSGSWPIYEFGPHALRTNARGQLVVHQVERGLQFGGFRSVVFGVTLEASTTKPDHALQFRCAGYQSRTLDFDALDRNAWKARESEVEGPAGIPLARVEVRVVMVRK